ncbi:hypothetical protein [Sediminibacillus massiliensis]|uniref:hypothetical protein n=1 Tax=Sediminibacillus massiliensis TaxID=1926277 RepID=UPI0009889026|nr:hypothetical protein [Sediminibacillus massiliensis]
MKKILAIITFLTFLLVGCNSSKEKMILLEEAESISVSKSNGFGGLNERYFLHVNQQKDISLWEKIISDAEYDQLPNKNTQPDFDILIDYGDGNTHGLHLFLGNKGEKSAFMYVGHEDRFYVISAEASKVLAKELGHPANTTVYE